MSPNSVRIICRSSDILDHTMNPISRRNMLAGLMGTTVAVGLPLAAATAEPQIKERPDAKPKLKVVVTGGHPGDPEYGCGGTIARYTDLGHEVRPLLLRSFQRGGHAAIHAHSLRGHHPHRTPQETGLLRARQPSPRQVLRPASHGHEDAGSRKRPSAGRGLHPARAKPRLRASDDILIYELRITEPRSPWKPPLRTAVSGAPGLSDAGFAASALFRRRSARC